MTDPIFLIVNGPDCRSLHDTVAITDDLARQIYLRGKCETERIRLEAQPAPVAAAHLILNPHGPPAEGNGGGCLMAQKAATAAQPETPGDAIRSDFQAVGAGFAPRGFRADQPAADNAAVEALSGIIWTEDHGSPRGPRHIRLGKYGARAILAAIRRGEVSGVVGVDLWLAAEEELKRTIAQRDNARAELTAALTDHYRLVLERNELRQKALAARADADALAGLLDKVRGAIDAACYQDGDGGLIAVAQTRVVGITLMRDIDAALAKHGGGK